MNLDDPFGIQERQTPGTLAYAMKTIDRKLPKLTARQRQYLKDALSIAERDGPIKADAIGRLIIRAHNNEFGAIAKENALVLAPSTVSTAIGALQGRNKPQPRDITPKVEAQLDRERRAPIATKAVEQLRSEPPEKISVLHEANKIISEGAETGWDWIRNVIGGSALTGGVGDMVDRQNPPAERNAAYTAIGGPEGVGGTLASIFNPLETVEDVAEGDPLAIATLPLSLIPVAGMLGRSAAKAGAKVGQKAVANTGRELAAGVGQKAVKDKFGGVLGDVAGQLSEKSKRIHPEPKVGAIVYTNEDIRVGKAFDPKAKQISHIYRGDAGEVGFPGRYLLEGTTDGKPNGTFIAVVRHEFGVTPKESLPITFAPGEGPLGAGLKGKAVANMPDVAVKSAATRGKLSAAAEAARARLKSGKNLSSSAGSGAGGMGGSAQNFLDHVTVAADWLAKTGGNIPEVATKLKTSFGLKAKDARAVISRASEERAIERVAELVAQGKTKDEIWAIAEKEFPGLHPDRYAPVYAKGAAKGGVAFGKNGPIPPKHGVFLPADLVKDIEKWDDINFQPMLPETIITDRVTKSNPLAKTWLTTHREHSVTEMITERAAWRNMLRDLPIGQDKNLSKLTMMFGEKKITLDQLKQMTPHWEAVVQSDKWFRSAYDDLLERVNATRTQFGMDAIPRRKDYYTHFSEEGGAWAAKTAGDAVGASEFAKPYTKFNPFAKRRTGDATTFDAVKAFEAYLGPTLNQIHLTEAATRRRILANALREEFPDTLPDFMTSLDDHADALLGVQHGFEKNLASATLGKKVTKKLVDTASAVAARMGANQIVGSVGSALMQTASLPFSVAENGLWRMAKGFKDEAAKILTGAPDISDSSKFLKRRYSDVTTSRPGAVEKGQKIIATPFHAIEETMARSTWRGSYQKMLDSGLSGDAAIREADRLTEKLLAGRAPGEVPIAWRTTGGRLALQFQLEVGRNADLLAKGLWEGLTPAQRSYKAAKLVGALYAMNTAFEWGMNRTPLPDPIRMAMDVYDISTGKGTIPEKILRSTGRVAGETLSALPAAGLIVDIPQISDATRKDLFGRTEVGIYPGGIPISSVLGNLIEGDWAGLASKVALPYGGGQIKKTAEGIMAGDKFERGNVRFTIDGIDDRIRAILNGPYSTQGAKEHFEDRADSGKRDSRDKREKRSKRPTRAKR